LFKNFHASRGGSGALYSQSAIVGVMFALRLFSFVAALWRWCWKIESCAIETCEPCQIRKEAALSSHFYVPQGRLVW